ncbi:hypothetical protein RCL1_002935 [Eukaryota sp. TZLM3-RCL]
MSTDNVEDFIQSCVTSGVPSDLDSRLSSPQFCTQILDTLPQFLSLYSSAGEVSGLENLWQLQSKTSQFVLSRSSESTISTPQSQNTTSLEELANQKSLLIEENSRLQALVTELSQKINHFETKPQFVPLSSYLDLEKQLLNEKKINSELTYQIEEQEQLKNQKEEIKNERDQLKIQLNQSNLSIKTLKDAITSVNDKYSKLVVEISENSQKIKTFSDEKVKMCRILSVCNELVDMMINDQSVLDQSNLIALSSQLSTILSKSKASRDEELTFLQSKLQSSTRLLKNLSLELNRFKELYKNSEIEVQRLRNQNIGLQSNNFELSNNLAQNFDSKDILDTSTDQNLSEILPKSVLKIQEQRSKIEELTSDLSNQSNLIVQLESQLQSTIEDYEERISELESVIIENKTNYELELEQVQLNQSKLIEESQEISELKDSRDQMLSKLTVFEQSIKSLFDSDCVDYDDNIQSIQRKLIELDNQKELNNQITSNLIGLEQSVMEIFDVDCLVDVELKKSINNTHNQKLSTLEQSNQEMSSLLSSFQEENARLLSHITSSNQDYDLLLTENELLGLQLSDLITNHCQLESFTLGCFDFDCDLIDRVDVSVLPVKNDIDCRKVEFLIEKISQESKLTLDCTRKAITSRSQFVDDLSSFIDLLSQSETLAMSMYDVGSTAHRVESIISDWSKVSSWIPKGLLDFINQSALNHDFLSSLSTILTDLLSKFDCFATIDLQNVAESSLSRGLVAADSINDKTVELDQIITSSRQISDLIVDLQCHLEIMKVDFDSVTSSIQSLLKDSELCESILMTSHDEQSALYSILDQLENKKEELLTKHKQLAELENNLLSYEILNDEQLSSLTEVAGMVKSTKKHVSDVEKVNKSHKSPAEESALLAGSIIDLLSATVSRLDDRYCELSALQNALVDADKKSEDQRTLVINHVLDEVVSVRNALRRLKKQKKELEIQLETLSNSPRI